MNVVAGSPPLELITDHTVPTGEGAPFHCIQCGTCNAVCPLVGYMDHGPRLMTAMVLAGRHDELLRSRAIWVCTACYACTVECPQQVPITDTIYSLKRESMRTRAYPRRFTTPVLARQFIRAVSTRGRSSEAWMSVLLYLRTRPLQLLRYVPLALRLFRRGRLRLRRESVRRPAELRRMLAIVDTTAGERA